MVSIGKHLVKSKKSKQRSEITSFYVVQKLIKKSIVLIVLALIWEIAPRIGIVDRAFFPALTEVFGAWWEMIASGELWNHFSASIKRSTIGFILALVIAIPLGLLIGWYPLARDLLNPAFEVFRNTATLALLPVFMLLLGIGEISKVSIVFYACTFPILLNTIAAVKNVDPLLIKSASSMNVSSIKLFTKVILPASVPTMFTGIRMAGTGCILVLIAAEMIGAKEGLGYFITYAQYNFLIPEMYAGILSISVLGLFVNFGLGKLEKRFSRWKPNPNE
ncbi:ABC transporter permease [Lysinibacillus sp. SGAir0095]|nr:ABC transporter permease [Lysinibacillus sp. SGAir0095]